MVYRYLQSTYPRYRSLGETATWPSAWGWKSNREKQLLPRHQAKLNPRWIRLIHRRDFQARWILDGHKKAFSTGEFHTLGTHFPTSQWVTTPQNAKCLLSLWAFSAQKCKIVAKSTSVLLSLLTTYLTYALTPLLRLSWIYIHLLFTNTARTE